MGVFAQKWTIDGSIDLDYNDWANSNGSEESTLFTLSLSLGRYFTDKLNVGLRGGLGITNTGNSLTVGPRIKYDFYQLDRILLSIFSSLYYTRFNSSYSWNSYFQENDANRIRVGAAPSVSFIVHDNIEVYWQVAELSFQYEWLTLKGTDIDSNTKQFRLAGIITNPAFGVMFRF